MSTLRRLFDIRPEERRNTFAAFATLLAITTGHTLLETARDTFFLAKMPVARLPVMYLVIVVIALALSQIKAARADSKTGLAASLVVAAGITTAFWALLWGGGASHRTLYALYVWTGLFGSWAMVQIWTLLGRVHTMTQAKRLYGFIGAGAVLGGVVGAILARVAITALSPRSAVLLAAGIFILAAVPCLVIHVPPDEIVRSSRGHERATPRRPMSATWGLLTENPFALRVLAIVLVSTVTLTVGDFLFKAQLAHAIPDTRRLGAYLSTFYGVSNGLAVVTQLVIAPWVFRQAGVQRALFFFPASMLAAAAGVVLSGGVLFAAVALKGLDGAFRYSIHKTSMELLLVPVPDGTRERVKPVIDLVGSRGGQALASLAILGLVALAIDGPVMLGAIMVGLALAWMLLAVTIRTSYLDVFRETLKSGGLSGETEMPELDLGALETLFAGLNSSSDIEVIASLELLAEQHRERLIPALILYHPGREVVLRALDLFTQMGRTDFVSIADRLNEHSDREVAAAALRARTAVMPDKKLLVARLSESCPQVSITALVALMARGWIDPDEAERRLEAAIETKSWQMAAELARSVRAVGSVQGAESQLDERFADLLLRLDELAPSFRAPEGETVNELPAVGLDAAPRGLGAPDVRVRLEVARAMWTRKNPRFLRPLVHMLNRHELRVVARMALLEIPGALEALDHAMSSERLPRDIRVHLPRTVCLFEPLAAAAVLLRHLQTADDGAVRFKIIRGLVKLRRLSPQIELDPSILSRVAEVTLDHAEELRRWGVGLARTSDVAPGSSGVPDPLEAAHHLLADLVRDKETHALQRVFLLLELIHRDPFDDIWRGLRSNNPTSHASSLELLENLVKPPLRERVLELVGERASVATATRSTSYEATLREILAHRSVTMRTLAEYRAIQLGIDISSLPRRSRLPEESPLALSLGERLLDKARDLLAPEEPAGATNAPA